LSASAEEGAASAVPAATAMAAAPGVPATTVPPTDICKPVSKEKIEADKKIISWPYLAAVTCIGNTSGNSHPFETEPPGFFDVGAGFAQIDTAGKTDATASGILVTVKAYPLGRWYARKKQASIKDTLEKQLTMLKEQMKALNNASEKSAEKPKTTTEKVSSDVVKTNAEYAYLEAVRDSLEVSKEFYPLQKEEWFHRISVFYGRSPGNFNEASIKGPVNAIGISYDIAPEFSLFFGKAYYDELLPGGTTESRQHNIFGVQMNFNAFEFFNKSAGK
jgi:hypothetical protein